MPTLRGKTETKITQFHKSCMGKVNQNGYSSLLGRKGMNGHAAISN